MDKRAFHTKGQTWEFQVGPMIRRLRKAKGMLLTDLAQETGFSVSFLSQLERGLTRPTFHSLDRTAKVLGSSARLILGASTNEQNPRVSVVKVGEALKIPKRTGTAYVLAKGPQRLSPLLVVDGPTEFRQYIVHEGAVFMYVLAGSIEVDLAEDGIHTLTAGDSISFAPRLPHRFRRTSREVCRLIAVEDAADGLSLLDDIN